MANGCSVTGVTQEIARVGRQAEMPLTDPTIEILVPIPSGKPKPDYSVELKSLCRMQTCQPTPLGIPGVGRSGWDGESLRGLKAYYDVARKTQQSDPNAALRIVLKHRRWEVVDPAEAPPSSGVIGGDVFTPAFDAAFAGIKTKNEKYLHCLQHIDEHGESEFLINCFGVAREDGGRGKQARGEASSAELFLHDMYWLLKSLGYVPPANAGGVKTMLSLEKHSVQLKLLARVLCIGAVVQQQREAKSDLERQCRGAMRKGPFDRASHRMRAVEELGVLVLESGTLRSGLRAEDGVLVPTDDSEREFKAEWLSS